MANTTPFNTFIAGLPAASSVTTGDLVYVEQTGVSKQATAAAIAKVAVPGGGASGTTLTKTSGTDFATAWKYGPAGTVYNVKDYGAKGDNSTDDTAAINSAIGAFNAAGGGRLYFPTGTYLVSSALTSITNPGVVYGDGSSQEAQGTNGATSILFSSTTAVLFTANTDRGLVFEDINMRCTGTATAGAGIQQLSTGGFAKVVYSRLSISKFFINIDVQAGEGWVIDKCFIGDPASIGVKVNNTVNVDAGDWFISNCYFNVSSAGANNPIGLNVIGSGGAKVVNCKWNGNSISHGWDKAISVTGAATIDFLITNCSIEGWNNNAILFNGSWPNVTISNIQTLGFLVSGSVPIKIVNNTNVVIVNCVLNNGDSTLSAVDISTGVTGVSVYGVITTMANPILGPLGVHYTGYNDVTAGSGFGQEGSFFSRGGTAAYIVEDQANPHAAHQWQWYVSSDISRFQKLSGGTQDVFAMTIGGLVQVRSGGVYGWTASSTDPTGSLDTGVSRSAAGVVALGNGAAGDGSASMLAKTKAGAPAPADIPAGCWTLIRDTTNNTTKVYYNNAGTLMSVALT